MAKKFITLYINYSLSNQGISMKAMNHLAKTNDLSIFLNHNNLVQIIEEAMVTYAHLNAYSCLGQSMTFAQVDKK